MHTPEKKQNKTTDSLLRGGRQVSSSSFSLLSAWRVPPHPSLPLLVPRQSAKPPKPAAADSLSHSREALVLRGLWVEEGGRERMRSVLKMILALMARLCQCRAQIAFFRKHSPRSPSKAGGGGWKVRPGAWGGGRGKAARSALTPALSPVAPARFPHTPA